MSTIGSVPAHCPELGPCEEWTGFLHAEGYGLLYVDRKKTLAHRYAFFLGHGRWPVPCANRDVKGRHGDTSVHGERNGRARVTVRIVRAIRTARSRGVTLDMLALKHGLSRSTVGYIVRGETWRDA